MIVPVNSEKYANLFKEAKKFLNLTDEINTLNAYYGHMRDFYDKIDKGGSKYIMMPLEGENGEEPLNINLNTRTITIPATLSKVGGVQSDQMAELLIFKADRYFDHMDLATTSIYVQWQLPDEQHTTGATAISIIDLDSEPGKIRFAWPLHDAITKNSGIVKFSVRFFLMNGDKLAYALNTLEANLLIKPALNPVDRIVPEDIGGLYMNAIINSTHTGDGIIHPVKPSFE